MLGPVLAGVIREGADIFGGVARKELDLDVVGTGTKGLVVGVRRVMQ